ncbi:MAG: hypothetical protein V2I54_05740 [Bacteroidales bacterium]|jgi:hypothetical protein|nr:hypothetical protein [Bacteroidales bacterium]
MQLNYFSKHPDSSYPGRVLLFIKRNFYLYLPDLIVLVYLVIPPYTWKEAIYLIMILLVLSLRDILLLRYSRYHLGEFVAINNDVYLKILKKGKLHQQYKEYISDIDMEINYHLGFPVLYILKQDELLFKQYATGVWSGKRMREFKESFYDFKKEQSMWKMFKGPSDN